MVDADRSLSLPLSQEMARQPIADFLVGQLVNADVVLDSYGRSETLGEGQLN